MDEIKQYWNNQPCNIKHSNKPIGTKEYFDEVEKRKYFVESHIPLFAEFDKYIGKNVLEIGCGIGTDAVNFARYGANYTGIDISPKSVEITKQRFDVYNLKGTIMECDIENIFDYNNFKNQKFDLVYSFGVLHHIPNISKAISNIKNLLKVGGEFKLMLYAKNSWKYFRICNELDQYEAQNAVPIANVYSYEEIYELLKDFNNIKIQQSHIFPYKIAEYKKYKYVKEDYFECMPDEMFKFLEEKLGWHLCISCNI